MTIIIANQSNVSKFPSYSLGIRSFRTIQVISMSSIGYFMWFFMSKNHTVFTVFVMTYQITVASYWLKFKFRFLCSLRPLFKKRGEMGAYIRNKISHITFKWLKSVFICINSMWNNCCFEGDTVWFVGYSIQAVRNSVNRIVARRLLMLQFQSDFLC